ncbi:RICIN domain-containing protein [Chitinophaga sp. Cy-1792]|uniref:RICIN domain-containing protein n=1 Tax=Chitinophaga sp. Cy-1792 TaxID=2608339 RepID=UPI00141D961B|nr:RICIN domain-containing protein [Chitinophaga sp. Cy-1792]NIG57132.1 RICIN domain-containing protein [Chitinophaga sp. Cy-1792]
MKKLNLLTFAAIVMASSLLFSCQKNEAVKSVSSPEPLKDFTPQSNVPGMVITPYGLVPSTHVFAVDNKTIIKLENGHLLKTFTDGRLTEDLGTISEEARSATDPYLYAARLRGESDGRYASSTANALVGTNYPGYTAQAAASDIQSFSTKWVVPPVPQESASTATTFLWNGIDRGALQPVLMWGATAGGAFYAIANWYYVGGNYYHGTYVTVTPGTQLEGVITHVSHTSTSWTYTESFTGYPIGDVTVTRPTEATGVIECWEAYTNIVTQWPSNLYSAMTNIHLTTRTTTPPATFNWSVTGGAITTPSGYNTVIVNNSTSNGEIDFYFDGTPVDTTITSGGIYKLVSATNNTSVLDVTGGASAAGTFVELWSNNVPSSLNQQWKITAVGSGYYKLEPQHAIGKALTVAGNATADGTQVQIDNYTGATGQLWTITSQGGGTFKLTPSCASASSLDVYSGNTANGTKVEIWTSNTANAQKFKLVLQ